MLAHVSEKQKVSCHAFSSSQGDDGAELGADSREGNS